MIAAGQLLWLHLDMPSSGKCEPLPADAHCWMCGGPLGPSHAITGALVKSFNGASFTGQNRVRCLESEWVCEACVYFCSRTSPVPGRPPKPGKKFGGNYRNYTHLYDERTDPSYCNASKGEKPAILDFLRRPHRGAWFAAIADSGQKHVLPWAPVNPPGARRGTVLFDETVVQLPVANGAGWTLVDRIIGLLTDGATKAEIETGDYTPRAWQLLGRERLQSFEEQWGGKRGSAWFGLALWLSQRDEQEVQRRMVAEKEKKRGKAKRRTARAVANANGGDVARAETSVSADTGVQCPEALGPVAESDAQCGEEERQPRRMGDDDATWTAAPCLEQLSLPGFG